MDPILSIRPLGFPWETDDPFLFCVYHNDAYPAGNEKLGPAASLAGRNLGADFEGKDGWRMYHGLAVPGFPQHPHRGFETVTIVRKGYVDHSDSLGATARYGQGDLQWLTAGQGIQHAEMFPLVNPNGPNPLELFQIWLNLPRSEKFAEPYFDMFWSENIPRVRTQDEAGRATDVAVYAGTYANERSLTPPPHSWANRSDTDVAIWTVKLEPGATWTLPAATPGVNRALYYFAGVSLTVAGQLVKAPSKVRIRPDAEVIVENGGTESEMLLLQGRPIGEPVVQYGPFVMNSPAEIQQAFMDYRRTGFGGWPWDAPDPVHPRDAGRFARRPDGTVERAGEGRAVGAARK